MSTLSKSPSLRAAPPSIRVPKLTDEVLSRKQLSVRHTLKIVLRNAVCAAAVRVLVGIVKLIVKKGLSKTFFKRVPGEVFSLDPLKWAAVFGGFSSFRFCMQFVSFCGKFVHLPEKLAALLSGLICSLPALVMNRDTRTELALYALVRALHTFALRFIYPSLPSALQKFQHYDVLLMCTSASQIGYACLFAPYTMPLSYQGFLTKAAMLDDRLMRGFMGLMRGVKTPELTSFLIETSHGPLAENSAEAADAFCQCIHPGYGCNAAMLVFIPQSMLFMGVPLYGPLRVVATLATQRRKLMTHPVKTIARGAKSVFTSSLFLALYVACIRRSGCLSLHAGIRGGAGVAAMCFFAGIPTLLEPKGRRMDLALYCSMYAIRSFVLTQYRFGHLPYPRHSFVLMTYFLSMAYMFFEYEEEPELLNPRVYSLFRMLLGEKAVAKTDKPLLPHHSSRSSRVESEERRTAHAILAPTKTL